MFPGSQYQLLDFGDGEKLEVFAGIKVRRPSSFAEGLPPQNPKIWTDFDLVASKRGHKWVWRAGQQGTSVDLLSRDSKSEWVVQFGDVKLQLKCTDTGQVGVFPEHARVWQSAAKQIDAFQQQHARPPKLLNLFAYTGGLSLIAAAAGAEVVHLDAAKPAVEWARQNAQLSGLADKPIRWICEHAPKFVQRELKRGNRYDMVVLDPPTYGHGPKNQAWKVEADLESLLEDCVDLLIETDRADSLAGKSLIVSCHSIDWPATRLTAVLGNALKVCRVPRIRIANDKLFLSAATSAKLECGDIACWPADAW